ncbi:MAG: hypothetical protein D3910_06580 [Candidatus Electrothrix sp. ATG2]|nr:hypothetical protein [Candidatus Electrothrix sp. ATG2]
MVLDTGLFPCLGRRKLNQLTNPQTTEPPTTEPPITPCRIYTANAMDEDITMIRDGTEYIIPANSKYPTKIILTKVT